MPITLAEDLPRRWLIATAAGRLTLPEILTFLHTARADVERRMMPLLFDARGATTDMTDDGVREAVALVRDVVARTGQRGHVALVADDDQFYARMLLYEALCAKIEVRIIRVFRQRPDAERWLDVVSAARHFR